MKGIASILLIYIVALVFVPCSDAANNCVPSDIHAIELQHDHGQDHDDACTPFCLCACCSMAMVTFNFQLHQFKISLPELYTKNPVIVWEFQFISNYFGKIWQPPRFNA